MINVYLLGVVLLHLGQPLRSSPKTNDLVLRAIRHVDQLLEQPAVGDGPADAPDDQTVLPDLDEGDAARRVFAVVNDERLSTHLTRRHRLQVDVVSLL